MAALLGAKNGPRCISNAAPTRRVQARNKKGLRAVAVRAQYRSLGGGGQAALMVSTRVGRPYGLAKLRPTRGPSSVRVPTFRLGEVAHAGSDLGWSNG